MDKYAIGRNIRKVLDKRKRSQMWLAEQIGTSNTIFTPWMSGRSQPSLMVLYRISRVLGVTMDSLMSGVEEDPPGRAGAAPTPMQELLDVTADRDYWRAQCHVYKDDIDRLLEERRWIPCSEKTPDADGEYWTTFGAETGWFVDWCSWHEGRWVVWIDDSPADVRNVVAWCKPMKPYQPKKGGAE